MELFGIIMLWIIIIALTHIAYAIIKGSDEFWIFAFLITVLAIFLSAVLFQYIANNPDVVLLNGV